MRFLLLAIALLVISLTPPLAAQSTDGEPEAETASDPPTAVSQGDDVKIRKLIEDENVKWSYYDMHFGLKEIKWNITRHQKDLKKLREMLTKNEAKAVELEQKHLDTKRNFTELNITLEANLEMMEYIKNESLTKEATKEYESANSAYAAVHDSLEKLWVDLQEQENEIENAEKEKKEIDNSRAKSDKLRAFHANVRKRKPETVQLDIGALTIIVDRAKHTWDYAEEDRKNSPFANEYEMLECADILKTHPDDDPCKGLGATMKPLYDAAQTAREAFTAKNEELTLLKKELEGYAVITGFIRDEVGRLTMKDQNKVKLLGIEDEKITTANAEIDKLKPQIKGLVDKMKPLAKIRNEKEAHKNEREAFNGPPPPEGPELKQKVEESRIELERLEDEQKDVDEKIAKIKAGLVTENYEYYYLTEKLKDVIKRREERKEQLKQMQFNWPREFLKLALIWFIFFVLSVTFVAYGMWTGFTGEGVGGFPFGPKPYWLNWFFGNREYWCDVKERELGDRNTHQQPYREGPEMWWPLKPWDIYQWIVVKISRRRHDDEEQYWDSDLFLRSDDLQHELRLRGDEYREDAQWDGAYKSMDAHYEEFNQAYIHFNRKDNARQYKIVNPVKMAGAYGPLLDRNKKWRHPDHKYPLFVPPPPPPMRPAKRIPRHILVVRPPDDPSKKETQSMEPPPDIGPDELLNYDGEIVPKRKHWEFYVRLHNRMRKETHMHCYKPWTRKWINDHFASYHERPKHSVTGESRKRGRRRGKRPGKKGRSTAGREASTTRTTFSKKHHRKHHTRNVKAIGNNEEKQALAGKLKAIHKKHCKRYRKRARIANLSPEQQRRLAKKGPRVLHRRIGIAPKKIQRMLVRELMKNPLKRILGETALREKKRDARKQKRAEKVKANPALIDAQHLKIRARKLRKHQARLRAENLRLDLAQHEKSAERRTKRHARQRDLHDMMSYRHHELLQHEDTSDDPADISEDEEERMNEEERAEYDPFPILLYPDPELRPKKHHKHCRFYEKKRACQKGEKYAKLHAAKHNMVHDHNHLASKRRIQECPPNCAHGHGGRNAVDANRLHHEHKRAAKTAQGPKQLARLHTKEHIRRHHEMHHKRPHMPHQDVRTRIKWTRIKHDRALLKKWKRGENAEKEEEKENEDEEKKKKAKKEGKKEKKEKKEKKKKDRKGPDGQPVISSIPDADGWKMDKEDDEEKQEEATQVGTGKISVMPNEKLERLAPMPDTPEEATQALTKTQVERSLEDKTQAMGGDLEPPPTTNKHQWPLPPSAPIAPPVGPEDDVTQEDKTAAPGTAPKKKSLPREDKPPKAGPASTFRI